MLFDLARTGTTERPARTRRSAVPHRFNRGLFSKVLTGQRVPSLAPESRGPVRPPLDQGCLWQKSSKVRHRTRRIEDRRTFRVEATFLHSCLTLHPAAITVLAGVPFFRGTTCDCWSKADWFSRAQLKGFRDEARVVRYDGSGFVPGGRKAGKGGPP